MCVYHGGWLCGMVLVGVSVCVCVCVSGGWLMCVMSVWMCVCDGF